jgi:ribosomal protein S8
MIAQKKKLSFIKVKNINTNYLLLNFLWDEGFIYGYLFFRHGGSNSLIVYLKKLKLGFSLLENIKFLNNSINQTNFYKNLGIIQKKTIFFILNDRGIFLRSYLVKQGLGGITLSKL